MRERVNSDVFVKVITVVNIIHKEKMFIVIIFSLTERLFLPR